MSNETNSEGSVPPVLASEKHISNSLLELRKSYKNWVRATIIVLTLEIVYFGVINYFFADNITVVEDYIGIYEDRFNTTLETARMFPEKTDYEDHVVMVEKVLDNIINAKENHASELARFENALDTVNNARDPEGVADMISRELVREIQFQGYKISTFGRDYLSEEMKKAPQWARAQIPRYGARLRHEVDNWIHQFCHATSIGLGETFDAFLDNHADNIREFSEATDDQATLDKLDEEFIEDLAVFMETTPIENYGSLKDQADKLLARIRAANELLKPLVRKETKDLTQDELRLRRAVGLFMHQVYNPPATPPSPNLD
jgi:hypothetical protein